MVNNQKEFNNTYKNKGKIKEIKIEDEYDFEGQLSVVDYLNLEKLYLHDIDRIDKVILKNLPQLQECTIWDCGVKELVISNCPNIETLNVRENNLTSLEFMVNLRNLTELDIEGNLKLDEILEPCGGDWRKWKTLTHSKGSAYDIQSSIKKNEEKVESETSSKKESKLETKIEIPPKGGN